MEFEEALEKVWELCDRCTGDTKKKIEYFVNPVKCEVTAYVAGKGMRKYVLDRVSDCRWTIASLREYVEE